MARSSRQSCPRNPGLVNVPGSALSTWALISVWVTILAFLVHEIGSLDIWWHLTIGAEIAEKFRIPTIDTFSALGAGRPYHDSHWLFQVVVALANRWLGMVGVQLVMILVLAATFAMCYRSCRKWAPVYPAALLMFLAAMASVERFLPRPEIVTFLGVAVFYDLLQRRRYRSIRELAVLVLVQVTWANAHGLFVIGPFMVGCYLCAELAGRFRGGGRNLASVGRAFATVLLSTLITPFGLGGWRYAALLFSEVGAGGTELMRNVGELSATFGDASRSGPAFWFFLALLVLGGAAAISQIVGRRVSARLLVVTGLAAVALTGRRNIVPFSLVAAPFVAEAFSARALGKLPFPRAAQIVSLVVIVGWAIYPLSGAYYVQVEVPARTGLGATPSFFPHGLSAFLDEIGYEGQVLNSNTLGGFYAYHGYPDRIPLTDGRWEVFEPDEIQRVLADSRHPSRWRRLVREYDISGILLAHTSPEARAMLPSLRAASDWRLVYLDRAASFWVPDDGSRLPPTIQLGRHSLPGAPRFDDGMILDAFLAGVGARELRVTNLERTLAFGRRRKPILERLGRLQIELGRFEEAEATFRALIEEDRQNAAARNELAFLAYRRGDLRRARDLLREAVELEPQSSDFRQNLERVEGMLEGKGGPR